MTAATPANMARALKRVCTGPVLTNEPLAPRTSWRVGGPADIWIEPKNRTETLAVIEVARERGWPFLALGNGSNVLVADAGVRGIVMNLTPGLRQIRIAGTEVKAGAGVTLFRLAKRVAKAGLAGAEFCIGVPGTLGGALAGNAGAFGSEIGDITARVELYEHAGGTVVTREAEEITFAYRNSSLAGVGIILGGTLALTGCTPERVTARLREITEERMAKQPVEVGSAGSVFQNPETGFAGQWIEDTGLKGLTVGGVMVSRKHANFMVNLGTATAADVRELIRTVKARVQRAHGVTLHEEVRYLGDWS